MILYAALILSHLFELSIPKDTGDGIAHFQIAKSSWQHPELLLDHWGKPLFTLLASPFAQFGFKGMVVFNLLCALGTLWFCQRISLNLGASQAWSGVLFLCCIPVYFKSVTAGLTEPLFALLLVASIDRLLKARFKTAMLIASFLIFCRPEAYIVIPFLALYAVWRRKWIALPWLTIGTISYVVLGWIIIDDPLWMIYDEPYLKQEPGSYAHGVLMSFLNRSKDIAGIPISIFFGLSTVLILIKSRDILKGLKLEFWLLILFPLLAVFAAHSIMWWKGLFGSLGLIRVMSTIMPLVAIVCALGLSAMVDLLPKPSLRPWLIGALSALLVAVFIERIDLDTELGIADRLTLDASEFVQSQYPDAKVFALHPLLGFSLDKDVYDEGQYETIWGMDKERPSRSMASGDLMIWDAHYSPQEGQIALQTVLEDEGLELLHRVSPDESHIIFGDRAYELLILRKR